LLLGLAVFSLDPIIQAYKELRGPMLTIQLSVLVAMAVFLYFAINQLGMMGAIAVAVAANVVERVAVTCAAARTLGAKIQDFALLKDVMKVTAACIGVIVVASAGRDLIHPDLVPLRLAVGSGCSVLLYAVAVRLFRLPGVDTMSKDWIVSAAGTVIVRLKRLRS
jgi:hypothetical protein